MASNVNKMGNWWKTEVGSTIIKKKYFHEDEKTAEDFFKRVASIFSKPVGLQMGDALQNADFFLGGRSLYGAGSKGKFKSSMSNCYILPMPEDNIENIFETCKEMARIFSFGGGCGVNLSKLRPRGATVNNSARTSTGAVSFMEIFDSVGGVIGANNRRAALIIGLNCSHPDIEEFLDVKRNNDKIQSANISILFDNEFMKAVRDNTSYTLKYQLQDGKMFTKEIQAREFFVKFAEAQHNWAEPGALFIDRIREHNLLAGYPKEEYEINISNPCAEYMGNEYNSCNLGSINLYNIIEEPFTEDAYINYSKLETLVKLGITALDEALDYGYEMQPLEKNRACIDDWRAIGLGVMGLADMLVALGVRYGSEESVDLVEDVMQFIFNNAVKTSALLAKEKGTFGKYNWDFVKESPLLKNVEDEVYDLVQTYGLRNGSLLSVAPTGTIATMSGMSGGVEPLFRISYERTTHALEKTGKTFHVFAKSVEHLLRYKGIDAEKITVEEIKKRFNYVVDSSDIDPYERIAVQASMQKWVDNAISSTINLKEETTVEEVFDIYIEAWKQGCKGITIFRDNCARISILGKTEHTEEAEVIEEENCVVFDSLEPIKREDLGLGEDGLVGKSYKGSTACVPKLYTTVNEYNGNIFEVFTNVAQGCTSNINTITRLASLALRSGIKVSEVVKALKGNQCAACMREKQRGKKVSNSCGSCVGEAIEKYYKQLHDIELPKVAELKGCACEKLHKDVQSNKEEKVQLAKCPECGERTLRPEGKCVTCSSCGFSKCD